MIVYLHGFNSSPQSNKAQVLGRYMVQHGLAAQYACPALPPLASDAIREIEKLAPSKTSVSSDRRLAASTPPILRRSTVRSRCSSIPRSIRTSACVPISGTQKNLHTGKPYELTEVHLRDWEKLYAAQITPARYLLIVETGDEVLDYRKAVARYAGAEQIVIPGGDHSLRSFPEHLPRILQFAGMRA